MNNSPARDRVIHLCAFRQESEAGTQDESGRMRRASARRRNRAQQQGMFGDFDD